MAKGEDIVAVVVFVQLCSLSILAYLPENWTFSFGL